MLLISMGLPPSVPAFLTAFKMLWYSSTVGTTLMVTKPKNPTMMATNSKPIMVIPRCVFIPNSLCLLETAYALKIADIHPYQHRFTHNIGIGHKAPIPRIL